MCFKFKGFKWTMRTIQGREQDKKRFVCEKVLDEDW